MVFEHPYRPYMNKLHSMTGRQLQYSCQEMFSAISSSDGSQGNLYNFCQQPFSISGSPCFIAIDSIGKTSIVRPYLTVQTIL